MKNRRQLLKICDEIKRKNTFLIFAHNDPDGDAIGSAVCMGLALKFIGKTVEYAIDRDKAGLWNIFDEGENFGNPIDSFYEAALILDCSTPDFIENKHLLSKCDSTLLIDHHTSNKGYGDLAYIDSDSSSTGEIIYSLVKMLKVPITTQMANSLFLSLSSDTGYFKYSNTKPSTHRVVADLHKYSDEFAEVAGYVDSYDFSKLLLIKEAIDSINFYFDGKLGIMTLTQKNGVFSGENDTDGIIDYVRNVRGCQIAVLIKELSKGDYKISIRSIVDNYDISMAASALGGGGHKRAAGFFMENTEIETVIDLIFRIARDIWTES